MIGPPMMPRPSNSELSSTRGVGGGVSWRSFAWGVAAGLVLLGEGGCQREGAGARSLAPSGISRPAAPLRGVLDLSGHPVDPLAQSDSKAVVLIFLSNDCPIANRYAPELRRLQALFSPQGVRFWWVHPAADESAESIRNHARDYGLEGGIVRDPRQVLVQRTGVTVTPEAAVYLASGEQVYRGRIDDRYVALGVLRAEPTVRDLEAALEAVLAGRRPATNVSRAVGCHIPALMD